MYFFFKHCENACRQRVTQVDIAHNRKPRDYDDCIFGSIKLGYLHKDSDQGWMENSRFGTN